VGAYSTERRRWGRINTLCSHLKTYFKANTYTKICLETMHYFWKKLQKNTAPVRTGIGDALTHALQSFKNTFLSRNLDQSMLKIALFIEKSWKHCHSVGGSDPQFPLASSGWVVPRPTSCYSHSSKRVTLSTAWILGIVKITAL